uniref:Uncharacterized protein n=1 Tax=Rhizophora mucronata TaxID=61149 RepID=A0A2P2NN73_RHIMU
MCPNSTLIYTCKWPKLNCHQRKSKLMVVPGNSGHIPTITSHLHFRSAKWLSFIENIS